MPGWTALSDGICQWMASSLVEKYSESVKGSAEGSPQAGSGPHGSADRLKNFALKATMRALKLAAQFASVSLTAILLASEKGLVLTAKLLTRINNIAGITSDPNVDKREAARILRRYQGSSEEEKNNSLKTIASAFMYDE